jgi:hypothetical protein
MRTLTIFSLMLFLAGCDVFLPGKGGLDQECLDTQPPCEEGLICNTANKCVAASDGGQDGADGAEPDGDGGTDGPGDPGQDGDGGADEQGDPGADDPAGDDGELDGGDTCIPNAGKICGTLNTIYWVDSCDQLGAAFKVCPVTSTCDDSGDEPFCLCNPGLWGDNCDQCVRYVDAGAQGSGNGLSWDNAYKTILAAVNETDLTDCDVWVRQAAYRPTSSLNIKAGMALYGGFAGDETSRDQRDWRANPTIIVGENTADNNFNHLLSCLEQVAPNDSCNSNSRVNGFVFSGGQANGLLEGRSGAAIFVKANPNTAFKIENCVFVNNTATYYGGAIYNLMGATQISNCVFSSNSADVHGPAVYAGFDPSPAELHDAYTVKIENSIFAGNKADNDQVTYNSGTATVSNENANFINCVFAGNFVRSRGSGISHSANGDVKNEEGITRIINCTFFGNKSDHVSYSSSLKGNAYRLTFEQIQVINSIFWNNTAVSANEFYFSESEGTLAVILRHNIIQQAIHGDGLVVTDQENLSTNPGFVAAAGFISGTWESVNYDSNSFQTLLVDDDANWTTGELNGKFVRPDDSETYIYPIIRNTADTIYIWGNPFYTGTNPDYRLYDFHIDVTSNCYNSGVALPTYNEYDIEGNPRDASPDRGAYEYMPD